MKWRQLGAMAVTVILATTTVVATPAANAQSCPQSPEQFVAERTEGTEALLTGLPVSEYSQRIARTFTDGPSTELTLVGIDEYSRFGAESNATVDRLWIVLEESDGCWREVRDNTGLTESLGLASSQPLWHRYQAENSLRWASSPHFGVLHADGEAAEASTVLDDAEDARRQFLDNWPVPAQLPSFVVIQLAATPADAAWATDVTGNINDFVAFARYRPQDPSDGFAVQPGVRLIVNQTQFSQTSPEARRQTIAHELTHVAMAGNAGPHTPVWLHEGMAEFVRLGRPLDYQPPSNSLRALPAASDFGGDRTDLRRAYGDAAAFVSYLATRFGPDAPFGIVSRLAATPVRPGTANYNVSNAVKDTTGMELSSVVDDWAAAP